MNTHRLSALQKWLEFIVWRNLIDQVVNSLISQEKRTEARRWLSDLPEYISTLIGMMIFLYTHCCIYFRFVQQIKNYANFHLLFHCQEWEMPIFQMSKRFCFLPAGKSIKLYHYLAGLSQVPERGRDWKKSRGTQLSLELELPVMLRCSHWQWRLYIKLNSGY